MNTHRARVILLAAALAAATGACADTGGSHTGTVVISAAGDADGLFPPTGRTFLAHEITDLVFDHLADIGPGLNTVGDAGWQPHLAKSWSWSPDSSSVTFRIDPRARWHDSVPVTAADVRFAFQVYTDPAVAASGGSDMATFVDSVSVSDSLTCTAWFSRQSPERFYALVFNLIPLPQHLLGRIPRDSLRTSAFAHSPVGDGPFRFVAWEPNQRIEIAAVNDYYRGRARPDRVVWSIVSQGQATSERLFNGEADFVEQLASPEAAEASKHPDVHTVHLRGNAVGYLLFNVHDGASDRPHPLLGDVALRRALTMSLDRRAIVTNLLDSLGTVALGPFARMQWTADSTLRQIAFDRAAASQLLDSLGWRMGKDSVRARGGKRLEFSLLVPASSANRQRLAVLLQEQWRQIGAVLAVERAELAAMNARTAAHKFDAVLMVIGTSPSPAGVRQAWSTAAISMANGFNLGRYSDALVDAEIDSAVSAPTSTAARANYRQAYQRLLDQAPAIWIFEPVIVAGAARRLVLDSLQDYAWWRSVPSWSIAAGSRPRSEATTRKP